MGGAMQQKNPENKDAAAVFIDEETVRALTTF